MAMLYQVRDNKGCGTEPMLRENAEAVCRAWIKRAGNDRWGSHRTGYQAWVREIEVTAREYALHTA